MLFFNGFIILFYGLREDIMRVGFLDGVLYYHFYSLFFWMVSFENTVGRVSIGWVITLLKEDLCIGYLRAFPLFIRGNYICCFIGM